MSPSSPPSHSFAAVTSSTLSGFTMPVLVSPDLSSPGLTSPRKAAQYHHLEGEARRQQQVPQPHLQYGAPTHHRQQYGSEPPTISSPTIQAQRSGAPSWMASLAKSEHSGDDGSWRHSNTAIEPDRPHPSNRFAFIPPRATFDSIAEWATARYSPNSDLSRSPGRHEEERSCLTPDTKQSSPSQGGGEVGKRGQLGGDEQRGQRFDGRSHGGAAPTSPRWGLA